MAEMDLKLFAREVHALAKANGFWDKPDGLRVQSWLMGKIALIKSELYEALDELREPRGVREGKDGKPEGFIYELADVIIRMMDFCVYLNVDLDLDTSDDFSPIAVEDLPAHILLASNYVGSMELLMADTRQGPAQRVFRHVLSMAGSWKALSEAMRTKHAYNKTRPYKHGKAF